VLRKDKLRGRSLRVCLEELAAHPSYRATQ
jgi:hypothetical protein